VFRHPKLAIGIAIAVLTWLVIIGGIKTIGRVAERLSPLKVGLYLVGGAIVILLNAPRIPGVLAMVVREAFTARSALGFVMFVAMRYGIARGIYANEGGIWHRRGRGTAELAARAGGSTRSSRCSPSRS
jgi:AGCS family alanine or glycine:cation symporter